MIHATVLSVWDTHIADDAMAPSLVTTLFIHDDTLIPVLPSSRSWS